MKAKTAWLDANVGKLNYTFKDKKYKTNPPYNSSNYWTCNKGKSYCGSICFNSPTLNKFAANLKSAGFKNVRNNDTWHISLYCKNEKDAKNKFETAHLVNFPTSLNNLQWYVWVVKKPGLTCSRDNETPCVESGCCNKSC